MRKTYPDGGWHFKKLSLLHLLCMMLRLLLMTGKNCVFPQWKRKVISWRGISRLIKKLFVAAIKDIL